MEVDLVGIATTYPSPRLILSAFAVSKLSSASPRLYAHNKPSPTAAEGALMPISSLMVREGLRRKEEPVREVIGRKEEPILFY